MTRPQTVTPGGTNPPQFSHLTKQTDLVTIGIGGNDVGLVGESVACLNLVPTPVAGAPEGLGGSCAERDTRGGVDQIYHDILSTAPKIATTLKAIHQRSPHPRVLLVNYLDAVPTNGQGCWPLVPVQNEDMAYLSAKFIQMNNMLGWMATLSHVQVVDTYSRDHRPRRVPSADRSLRRGIGAALGESTCAQFPAASKRGGGRGADPGHLRRHRGPFVIKPGEASCPGMTCLCGIG